jgi:excisionase family DNA binding protein
MALQIIPNSEEFENRFEVKLENLKESLLTDLKTQLELKRPEEYLTRQEVAKLLKVHVSTIDDWTDRGKLKRYKIYGRRALYKRSEVDASLIPLN